MTPRAQLITRQSDAYKTLSLGILTGSSLQQESISGEAHFLEHMCFKANTQFDIKTAMQTLDTLSGQVNAMTARDYTLYHMTVPCGYESEALPILLGLYTGAALRETDIEKERGVILEEMNMIADMPDELADDLVYAAAFGDPFGREILGTPASVTTITADSLAQFRAYYYNLDRVVISAVGNPDAIQWVDNYIASYTWPAASRVHAPTPAPVFRAQAKYLHRPSEQTHFSLLFPTCARSDAKRYGYSAVAAVLGGTMSSRLFQAIREDRGWAYSIYAHCSFYEQTGTLAITGGISTQYIRDTLDIIQSTLQSIRTEGLHPGELDRVKRYLKNQLIVGLETTGSWMGLLAKTAFSGDYRDSEALLAQSFDAIDAINAAIIHERLQGFSLENAALAIVGPTVKTGTMPTWQALDTLS